MVPVARTRAVHARKIKSVARMNVISRQTVCTRTVITTAIVRKMRVVATMNAEILKSAATETHVIRTLIVARTCLATMELVIAIHMRSLISFSTFLCQ